MGPAFPRGAHPGVPGSAPAPGGPLAPAHRACPVPSRGLRCHSLFKVLPPSPLRAPRTACSSPPRQPLGAEPSVACPGVPVEGPGSGEGGASVTAAGTWSGGGPGHLDPGWRSGLRPGSGRGTRRACEAGRCQPALPPPRGERSGPGPRWDLPAATGRGGHHEPVGVSELLPRRRQVSPHLTPPPIICLPPTFPVIPPAARPPTPPTTSIPGRGAAAPPSQPLPAAAAWAGLTAPPR